MEIQLLPFVLTAIGLTFALAILGWWIAQRVERKRRIAKRIAETNRTWESQGGLPGRRPGADPR